VLDATKAQPAPSTGPAQRWLFSFHSSLPGLTRQSIILAKKMDARIKSAHDD
jgi:hypothetical protein